MKNVIHIYGASGSGTSTLGRKICDELGYKFMDSDDYFWMPTIPQYLKKRERAAFGDRIDVGGDMHQTHMEFIEWAKAYDTGGTEMRSKAKHDAWEQLLPCRRIVLDGAADLQANFEIVANILRS